jgi:pyruvate formate lyase activating enzyme
MGMAGIIKGKINSFQSMGAVDGPGVRFVVFMQGCPLRCVYCHNPETWDPEGGADYSVEEALQKIRRFRPYFGKEGGVTVSGGEPLLQWKFVAVLFRKLKEEGIHTALDTSGAGNAEGAREVLKYTDLVLCDLKFGTEEEYRRGCGGSLEQVLSFLALTEEKGIPLWIRHVVVPGLTDSEKSLKNIAGLANRYGNLQKIELLPFKKLCVSKYEALGIPFPLDRYESCPDERIPEMYQVLINSK